MELRELDPFVNNYIFPITRYTPCILKQEYLGIVNLPLVSKINMCNQLLVSIDYEIEAVGPDETTITIKPLGELISQRKLLARTPLTDPTRTNNWVPPRINSKQILDYAKQMNILVKEDKEVQLNILPYPLRELIIDEKVMRFKEGGLILYEDLVRKQVKDVSRINGIELVGDEVKCFFKGFTIVSKITGNMVVERIMHREREGYRIYSNNTKLVLLEDMLYVNSNSLVIEHEYYNILVRYLQPLGFAEEELSRARITSPVICMESVDQNSICMVSSSPITLDIYPGRILVSPYNSLYILFSKRMFEWNIALNILWSIINKPVKIKAGVKTILWRITPYAIKPLYFKSKPISDKKTKIKLVLWNSSNKFVQADIWFPGKIISAKILDHGFREVEELIPDYDRVKIGIPSLGISIIELELLRLPSLLLRELMKRNMLSPYTPL